MEKEKLCLRCMRKIGDSNVCPYCKNENGEPQRDPYLPLKTVVGGRFLVGKLIAENSEGFTYYAFDLERKMPVTLRELFPKGLLSRGEGNYCLVNVGKASEFIDAKEEFLKLWKKLSSLGDFTALTPVYAIAEDLGTVYAVTEYLGEGVTLREYLLEQEQGFISWDTARVLFMPVISAIGELHSVGIVHGGISPTTLIIDKNGKLRITGYSVETVRRLKSNMEAEIFDGYAAVEQYGFSEGLGTGTDIYAFAAVLYRALIGSTPMSAASRLTNDKLMIPGRFAEQLPAYVINALVNALQILPADRTATAEQLRDELSASPVAAGTAAEAISSIYASHIEEDKAEEPIEEVYEEPDNDEDSVPDSKSLKKSTVVTFIVSVIACLAVLTVVLISFKGCTGDNNEDESTTEDSTEYESSSESETENTSADIVSINVPSFKGKVYEEIKNKSEYSQVLIFKTEYIDSDEDKGTVISQDVPAGTSVNSLNPRTVTLKVSSGREVPDVNGLDMKDAISELKKAGFKKIEARVGHIADSEQSSQKVYSLVYEEEKTGNWSAIPDDRHLSASTSLVVYYYGEYTPPETESQTTEQTEQITDLPADNGETATENDDSTGVGLGSLDSFDTFF